MSRPKRPAGAAFIAVCNILLGLPCLCCTGVSAFGNGTDVVNPEPPAAPGNKQEAPPAQQGDKIDQMFDELDEQGQFLAREVPHQSMVMLAINVVLVIASLALLVSGVGLLIMRPWGRMLCLAAALVLATVTTAEIIYDVIFLVPATKKFDEHLEKKRVAQKQAAPPMSKMDAVVFVLALTALLGVGYPILAIVVMMTAPVRAAYAGAPADEHDRYRSDDDFDASPRRDEDDSERWRDDDR